MLKTGEYFSKADFEKVFDELDKNKSDFTMCEKLDRHSLLIPKGSQDRQSVRVILIVEFQVAF